MNKFNSFFHKKPKLIKYIFYFIIIFLHFYFDYYFFIADFFINFKLFIQTKSDVHGTFGKEV